MDVSYWEDVDHKAKSWIEEAGQLLRDSFKSTLNINFKSGYDDLVTNMDKSIEQFFIEKINTMYPDHKVVSEEGFGDEVESEEGILWLLDPIDGTMNFVHQQRHFAISIGIFENGIGRIGLIYDVVSDDLYHCIKGQGAYLNEQLLPELPQKTLDQAVIGLNATWVTKNRRIDPNVLQPLLRKVRGTRSFGSAALELAYVASGKLDSYISMRLSPWDYGAGQILVEEVGGVVSRVDGNPIRLLKQNSVFAANKDIHHIIMSDYIQKGIEEGLYMEKEHE